MHVISIHLLWRLSAARCRRWRSSPATSDTQFEGCGGRRPSPCRAQHARARHRGKYRDLQRRRPTADPAARISRGRPSRRDRRDAGLRGHTSARTRLLAVGCGGALAGVASRLLRRHVLHEPGLSVIDPGWRGNTGRCDGRTFVLLRGRRTDSRWAPDRAG